MRRLVLLGLLGLSASACKEEEEVPPAVEEQLCPGRVPDGLSTRTPEALATTSAAAVGQAPTEDRRQRVLVSYRSRTGGPLAATVSRAREDRVERLGGQVRYHWPDMELMAARLTPEEQARLAEEPDVLSIRPDRPVYALGLSPLAPVSALLAAPSTTGSPGEYTAALKSVQAPDVWDANGDGLLDPGAPTGEGVTVCVVDSGLDNRHPELLAAYAGGRDFVPEVDDDLPWDMDTEGKWGGGHGTHVAGTIAAQLGSGGQVDPNDASMDPNGMVGVAPGARLLIARVLNERGNGNTSDVIEAVRWCMNSGANIISLSLGSTQSDEAEKAIFDEAWANGVLSLAASGNGGAQAGVVYPAGYGNVMAVGAVDSALEHPDFSQTGEHVSLVAPGVRVFSTFIVGSSPYSELDVGGGSRPRSGALEYSPFGTFTGKLVDCGLGAGLRSCLGTFTCEEGFVAYVDRGDLTFAEKVKGVLSQGARAVVIGNNNDEDDVSLAFTLGGPGDYWVPTVAVPTTSVADLKSRFGSTVTVGIKGYDYSFSTGTSMATPQVAGVAALLWSARPDLTNAQVRDVLELSAQDLGETGRDPLFGFGLVRAKEAIELANSTLPVP